jgi:histidine ammonia-lyase
MGANAATKCLRIVDNLERILAIELMNASQALSFREPKKSSTFIESFIKSYREVMPIIEDDTILSIGIKDSISFLQTMGIESDILFE